MTSSPSSQNLPAQIAAAIAGVPAAMMPSCVKALDRLMGAAVDIPVAWLEQQKAKIEARTSAFKEVDAAIAISAATRAGMDSDITSAALNALLRKEYRRAKNVEAVSAAMIEDLQTQPGDSTPAPTETIEDDWLNVFEKYAETASSERMQQLWGRVLAGEVRRPGKFSLRTLRFLSEFSQADALTYSVFCESTFADIAPVSLVKPPDLKDMRELIYLEAGGLIQGASGLGGLSLTLSVNEDGNAFLREGALVLLIKAKPETKLVTPVVTLTPLGQELVTLLPGRDQRAAAEKVAHAIRTPEMNAAYLCTPIDEKGNMLPMKVLWQDELAPPQSV